MRYPPVSRRVVARGRGSAGHRARLPYSCWGTSFCACCGGGAGRGRTPPFVLLHAYLPGGHRRRLACIATSRRSAGDTPGVDLHCGRLAVASSSTTASSWSTRRCSTARDPRLVRSLLVVRVSALGRRLPRVPGGAARARRAGEVLARRRHGAGRRHHALVVHRAPPDGHRRAQSRGGPHAVARLSGRRSVVLLSAATIFGRAPAEGSRRALHLLMGAAVLQFVGRSHVRSHAAHGDVPERQCDRRALARRRYAVRPGGAGSVGGGIAARTVRAADRLRASPA